MQTLWALFLSSTTRAIGLALTFGAMSSAALASFYLTQGRVLWSFGCLVLAIILWLVGAALLVIG